MNTTTEKTKHLPRKTVGFILTVITMAFVGWVIAWNQAVFAQLLGGIVGGVFGLVGITVFLVALGLVVFWPSGWPTWVHRLLIGLVVVTLVVILFFTGAQPLVGQFFVQAWLPLLALAGSVLALVALFCVTVLEAPLFWRKRNAAKASSLTSVGKAA